FLVAAHVARMRFSLKLLQEALNPALQGEPSLGKTDIAHDLRIASAQGIALSLRSSEPLPNGLDVPTEPGSQLVHQDAASSRPIASMADSTFSIAASNSAIAFVLAA